MAGKKRRLINSGLFFVSLILTLIALEILARTFYRPRAAPTQRPKVLVHEASPNLKLLYKPSPGAQSSAYGVPNTINRLGFRDHEYPLEKPAGTRRIVFLGDSVVYGYGLALEDTIPKRLESLYQEAGERTEVLNLGVSGYETEQAVEFFKEAGARLKPDLVLLGYTLNDSIYASMELDFFHDQLDYQVDVQRTDPRSQVLRFLFDHSRLFQWLDTRLRLQERHKRFRTYRTKSIWYFIEDRNRERRDPPESPYQRLKAPILRDAQTAGTSKESLRQMLGFVGIDNDVIYSSHWNVSEKAVRELVALGEQNGFRVVVAVFPYMLDLPHYALESVHRFLCETVREAGAGCIDLLPAGRQIDLELGRSGLLDPIHFSALGTQEIAQAIFNDRAAWEG